MHKLINKKPGKNILKIKRAKTPSFNIFILSGLMLFFHGPVAKGLIPTGKISSVKGTPLDFNKPFKIGKRINDELQVKKGDRIAIIGDSITEQKQYTKFMEAYLLACVPELELKVMQYGRGGETAPGFANRMV